MRMAPRLQRLQPKLAEASRETYSRLACIGLTLAALSACGAPPPVDSTASSIVNGQDETGYPAVGSLRLHVPGRDPTGSLCSGTLIDERWVLTAAHCIDGAERRVPDDAPASGTFFLHFFIGDDVSDDSGRLIAASRIVMHPRYDAPGGKRPYDIALFELAEAVRDVPPMPIRRAPLTEADVGAELFYVGFGVNDPDGGGSGTKRSVAAQLAALAPAIYATEQRGGGVCFGDSGGPGLMMAGGQQEVIGVNSTVFGQPCLHYSSQVRVDAYHTWIDEVLGRSMGGCAADPTTCQCDGVCGEDGVCDNAACGESDCQAIATCLGRCRDTLCGVLCYLRATAEAGFLNERLSECAREHCNNARAACVDRECRRERAACLEGFEAATGDATCGRILRCNRTCDSVDVRCQDECYFEGTVAAQDARRAIERCVAAECDDAADPATCAAMACRDPLLACMPDERCQLSGGDCAAGAACVEEPWIATYCAPSSQLAIGAACAVGTSDCVDGAMCVGTSTSATCREVCTVASDCTVEFPPCAAAPAPLAVGLCNLTCGDADGDGSCDRDDCAPHDRTVHPGATEVCDPFGLDENCDGVRNEGCLTAPPPPLPVSEPGCGCEATQSRGSSWWALLLIVPWAWRRREWLVLAGALALVGCSDPEPAAPIDAGPHDAGFIDGPDAAVLPPPGIWDLQQGTVEAGRTVTLEEVVVTSPAAPEGFFISDETARPYSGLFVQANLPNRARPEVSLGDLVTVTGTVGERAFGVGQRSTDTRTQLVLSSANDLAVVGRRDVPAAVPVGRAQLGIADRAELYEGVVVTLADATVTATSGATGELVLDDVVTVDDLFVAHDLTWLEPGTRFEAVSGPLHFDRGAYKIAPRSIDDLPRTETSFDGCVPVDGYVICLERARWLPARAACASLGGRLVVLETAAESDTVGDLVREWTDRSFWIALSDRATEGDWRWTDGSTVTYSRWADGEPNDCGNGEDCATNNFRSARQWNDASCGGRQVYVCEFEREPPRCAGDEDCTRGSSTCRAGSCVP